jgi:hypothetical protein
MCICVSFVAVWESLLSSVGCRMTVNDEFEELVKEGVVFVHTWCAVPNFREATGEITESHNFVDNDLNPVRNV